MFVDVTVVSIHTPTWGVTEVSRVKRWEAEVSIHTPTWGVTSTSLTRCCNSSFQSTHLHEVWLMFGSPKCWGDCVSIHTPTWGVTINTMLMVDVASVSIHTPTWGVTSNWVIIRMARCSFNPHTYMRCDTSFTVYYWMTLRFQSTHLHEVWPVVVSFDGHDYKFQSTHLHEVWHEEKSPLEEFISFNPHTYMRCDLVLPERLKI